jgi:hypothetical protein
MASNALDLVKLFSAVTKNLSANQASLNQVDTYNHDHGSNIAGVFNTITSAVKAKSNATPSEQLAYASQKLQSNPSGSAKFYSQSLAQTASQFQGQKQLAPENAMTLLTSLLGGAQTAQPAAPAQGGGDLLGALLGGLGGEQPAQPAAPAQTGGDLLGALLGGLGGGTPASASDNKLDMNDLITAGLSYMQSKQTGASDMEAIVGALIQASPLAANPARASSAKIIASTVLSNLAGKVKAARAG